MDTLLIQALSMAPFSVCINGVWLYLYITNNVPSYVVVFTVSIETVEHYAVILCL